MRELICVSVILIGFVGGRDTVVSSYIPTVATAAAAVADRPLVDLQLDLTKPLSSCLNGRCGIRRPQAVIKAGATTTKVRTRTISRRRLFRARMLRRR